MDRSAPRHQVSVQRIVWTEVALKILTSRNIVGKPLALWLESNNLLQGAFAMYLVAPFAKVMELRKLWKVPE